MKSLLLISAISSLNLISLFSILLPLAAGFIQLKLLGKEFRLLFVLIAVSFAVDSIAFILGEKGANNLWLGNIFYLVECFFWSFIMMQWLQSKKAQTFILIFLGAYFIAWGFTTFFVLDFFKFNTYARTIESVAFVFLSCFLLIAVSTDTSQVIFKNPKFWFGSALLIYFSVNIIVFGTVNYIASNHGQLMDNTWMIHSFTNIFANLLFAIGFLWIRQKAI